MPAQHYCMEASYVGDLNGDGASDVALIDNNPSGSVRTLLIHLGKRGAAQRAVVDVPSGALPDSSSTFGRAINAAGDLNGDGFGDMLVGDQSHDDRGRVLVIFGNGGATLEMNPDGILVSTRGLRTLFGGTVF